MADTQLTRIVCGQSIGGREPSYWDRMELRGSEEEQHICQVNYHTLLWVVCRINRLPHTALGGVPNHSVYHTLPLVVCRITPITTHCYGWCAESLRLQHTAMGGVPNHSVYHTLLWVVCQITPFTTHCYGWCAESTRLPHTATLFSVGVCTFRIPSIVSCRAAHRT